MNRCLILALGVGLVGAAVVSNASAQDFSIGIGPAPRSYDDRPAWRPPQPRPYYEREGNYVYRGRPERECWVESRWVETPYGQERRRVRVCE